MNILSKETKNLGRQPEIDLLRGMTAIFMIVCHVGLYLGNEIGNGLWIFCDLIGSEWGAPVFMALMGISQVYSSHQDPKDLFMRGNHIFVLGYLLSFFRSLLPMLLFGNIDDWASVEAFLVIDILQFAGLSFMFIGVLKKIKISNIVIFAVSVVMVVIDQFIMLPESVSWDSAIITGIVNLFCPTTEWSCFPFLTWFVFVAFGLVFGDVLTHCVNKKKLYGILLPIGLPGVIYVYYRFYVMYPDYTDWYWGNNFYYMGIKNVLFTILFICFALSFWYFAEKICPSFIKKFLCFVSKNINTYYLISWVIISVLIHAQAVYKWRFNSLATIGLTVLLIFVFALLTKAWLAVKSMVKNR